MAAIGMLMWSASPAVAANKDVTITTTGTVLQCDAASYAYSPANVTVNPGDTVTFTNPSSHGNACSPAEHPTRCAPETNFGKTKGECPFSNFRLDVGATHRQPFPDEGTFQLQCLVHPYMLMTVVVGDGEPNAEPTEPDPTQPEPEPTQPGPEPTATATATADPTATATPTALASATEEPTDDATTTLPTEAATDPAAQDDVEAGGGSSARGPLLIVGTALLGFNIAMFLGARNPATRLTWLR